MRTISEVVEAASTIHTVTRDGRWASARPIPACFWARLKDAWQILRGRADAVWYEDPLQGGGSRDQVVELTDPAYRNGYLRARAEGIRIVKQLRDEELLLSGPLDPLADPIAVIEDALGRLQRLDPDCPPEGEASHGHD